MNESVQAFSIIWLHSSCFIRACTIVCTLGFMDAQKDELLLNNTGCAIQRSLETRGKATSAVLFDENFADCKAFP